MNRSRPYYVTLLLLMLVVITLSAPLAAQDTEETTITIADNMVVSTLDPIKSIAAADIIAFGQLYSRLMRQGSDGELEPGLAESYETSEDGLTWTFHLREAQFYDGSPITADDVVFSYLRMRDQEDSAYSGSFQIIEDVVALDDRTVQFTLTAPTAPFLSLTEVFNTGIVPRAAVESMGDEEFGMNPVTSGPYMVREWIPNDRLILERNPYYWREGYPIIDVVEFINVQSDTTRASMIQTGEADVATAIPWAMVDQLRETEGIEVVMDPSSVINVVLLNHTDETLANQQVRQAMAMGIDVASIVEAVTFGYGEPANSLIPNTLDYYDPALEPYPYDPEAARALVEEAGATGAEIEFLVVPGGSAGDQILTLIQDQLSGIGLNVRITQVDSGTWWDRVIAGDYGAAVTWWYNETDDPDLAVRWALCGECGNSSFFTFYNSEEVNRLADEALQELDPERRGELYRDIQRIALEDVAQIPLYYQPYRHAYRDYVENLTMTPALQWTLEEASLSEQTS